uniref:Integrase catalytic domain-containing protein n=1 Tax=Arundo donax TaxID=35708 RepID=A0A0A9D2Z3_ARUDO
MDWLEANSPMQVNWKLKTLKFEYENREVFLQGLSGISCNCISGPLSVLSIAGTQLEWRDIRELYTVEDSIQEEDIPDCIFQILEQFSSVLDPPSELPPHREWDHRIPLLPISKPINIRPYRYSPAQKDEIERQIAEMLKAGIIRHSTSPFSSPVLLVPKKDKSWHFCVDFRHLNAMTIKNKFPLPIIDEFLDELANAAWFTRLDFCSGFHQIRMAPGEEYKMTFQTHSGHYEFCVMPFGLSDAPPTFQGGMNQMLEPMLRKFVLVFMDDILVYSPTLEDHMQHVAQVLAILQAHRFQVKKSKCSFAQQRLAYLGHVISAQGVVTDLEKIKAVRDWPSPTNVKELRSFLGLAGYYRKFVRNFGIISRSVTELLKKDTFFVWTSEKEQSFQVLKEALVQAPVLALSDFSKQFTIETDACEYGIGAVLLQDGHPLAYLSKALGPRNRGLSTYEKESLVNLLAMEQWRPYLLQGEFIIKTNEHSLSHLDDQRLSTPWQQWALTKLLGLSYKIQYKKGSDNKVVDALSRRLVQLHEALYAISAGIPVWIQEVLNGYTDNPKVQALLQQLAIASPNSVGFSLRNGIIYLHDKVWLAGNEQLQLKVLQALHASAIGGHSGFPVIYRRISQLFTWPGMKKQIKHFVQTCVICQQAKPERVRYPGLLQPLPVPTQAWQVVSMDFIEGSSSYDCILVVVDKLTKYAHFLPLRHSFTAQKVALAYINNVYKLHGLPESIVSDRDRIFTSTFWQELFRLVGTHLKMSSTYHPRPVRLDGTSQLVFGDLFMVFCSCLPK